MTDKQIMDMLVNAVKSFYLKESRFITDRVCERAIVGRIVLYLSRNAKKWGLEVFTEFNKSYQEGDGQARAKTLDSEIQQRTTNYPDILVLRCSEDMKPCDNILVVETKYYDNPRANNLTDDIFKLSNFTKELSENDTRQCYYSYPIGGHLFFDEDIFVILWYKNGMPFKEVIYKKNGNRFERTQTTFRETDYEYDLKQHKLVCTIHFRET